MSRSIIVAGCIALLAVAGCSPKDPASLVVAKVNTIEITLGDFEATAESIESRYLPATADLAGKKELLDHMINKEAMTLKAYSMGYDKDPQFVERWNEIRGAMLISALELVATRENEVSDEEAARYFDLMHNEYTLSQIVVANEDEALALRERILAGEDFAALARTYSIGPGAEQGGFVGSNTVGNIHWWVEEALFEMESGDVSMPLRTTAGFALIKIHGQRRIIPERDEAWARQRVKAIKDRKSIEAMKAQVEKEIGLQFFPEAVNMAFDALPEQDVPYEDIMNYQVTRENAPKLNLPPQHRQMLICQYADGSYTLADFEQIYEATGLPARPRRQFGKEQIVQTMHRQVFDKVLPVYAEVKARVLEDPDLKARYESRRDRLIVQRLYKDQIMDEVVVTDREVRDYYLQHQDNLMTPERRDFALLVVGDERLAREIRQQAAGSDFSQLVRQYSLDEGAKENLGRTGLHARGALPELDDVAFALPSVGSISEPIETSRGWVIVKIEAIEEPRIPTFEEARERVRKHLNETKMEETFKEKVAKWRDEITIEINEKNLERAQLNRTRS